MDWLSFGFGLGLNVSVGFDLKELGLGSMGFGLGLLNGFEFDLNVECGNGALSIRIGPRRAWADWVK